ncbi:MAG TPA: 6-pyruvoyl tetrahydropterin synthase family protein [Pirellulales bacterium]|jgi:6-pyruvoyltetrahydropterin/6-carboxytetrahydropterin synthase|nr:6-pyruvoyl tetrahydropterin synthase family protein [Pirellulales bacterium]
MYHVRIAKDYLIFSAAHFITYGGDVCERLHGHNYRVAAEVFGPLDENHYVFDFVALREILKELVGEWDHRMLLPTEHPLIRVERQGAEVEARFRDRRWVFPADDCLLLPIPNTTTELLARLLGENLIARLEQTSGRAPDRVLIEIDECDGQLAIWDSRD